MPKLATFPKAELEALVDGSLRLSSYLDFAATLDVDGVELYPLIVDLENPASWSAVRAECESKGLEIPMLCCSPDFTHPDPAFRAQEIAKEQRWIEMSSLLGARFCRVLSGQRRPELSRAEGIELAAASIQACLPFAADHGVTLIIENHYKDGYWQYAEFAQKQAQMGALGSSSYARGAQVMQLERQLLEQKHLEKQKHLKKHKE